MTIPTGTDESDVQEAGRQRYAASARASLQLVASSCCGTGSRATSEPVTSGLYTGTEPASEVALSATL